MGYVKVINSKQCWCYFYCLTDINDCRNNTCEQRCIDHLGYYNCDCFSGYHLMDDHRSCEGETIVPFPSLNFSSVIIESLLKQYKYSDQADVGHLNNIMLFDELI